MTCESTSSDVIINGIDVAMLLGFHLILNLPFDSIPLLSINSVCISTDLARARHACMLSYLPGATEASNYSKDGG